MACAPPPPIGTMLCSKEHPPAQPAATPNQGCFQFETDYTGMRSFRGDCGFFSKTAKYCELVKNFSQLGNLRMTVFTAGLLFVMYWGIPYAYISIPGRYHVYDDFQSPPLPLARPHTSLRTLPVGLTTCRLAASYTLVLLGRHAPIATLPNS